MPQVVALVCSVCGSKNWYDVQKSIDKRWPIARCRDHKSQKEPFAALISERAFARKSRTKAADPADLFGDLSDEEQAALRKPIRLHPLVG